YVSPLEASDVRRAVMELSRVAGSLTGVKESIIAARVLEREAIMHTGIGNGIAVPHARMAEISRPWVIVGKSPSGIDFDAFDGKPAHLIFLILTPMDDQEAQIQILAQIARIFSSPAAKELAMNAKNFIEFMSAVKSSGAPGS
ncbi:MAG TPA: PTS sugar transporter subunit IIA, partial [Spirochaetes bacterium]|nr:PTS sugar transporter subunit IIA [Spirochaetota bacterium]